MGSAKLIDMIGRVLTYLLKAAGKVIGGAVGLAFAVGVTILDQIAWLLNQAVHASVELGRGITTLVGMIFKFLGRTVIQGTQITVAFLRWVLELLFSALRSAAHLALSVVG